jgi:hypothetical protein
VVSRFSVPIQNGTVAHPASCAMRTGAFLRVKRPGGDVDHPPPSSAKVKERVELYFYSTSGPSWPVLGLNVPLPFTCLLVMYLNSKCRPALYCLRTGKHRPACTVNEVRVRSLRSPVSRSRRRFHWMDCPLLAAVNLNEIDLAMTSRYGSRHNYRISLVV